MLASRRTERLAIALSIGLAFAGVIALFLLRMGPPTPDERLGTTFFSTPACSGSPIMDGRADYVGTARGPADPRKTLANFLRSHYPKAPVEEFRKEGEDHNEMVFQHPDARVLLEKRRGSLGWVRPGWLVTQWTLCGSAAAEWANP